MFTGFPMLPCWATTRAIDRVPCTAITTQYTGQRGIIATRLDHALHDEGMRPGDVALLVRASCLHPGHFDLQRLEKGGGRHHAARLVCCVWLHLYTRSPSAKACASLRLTSPFSSPQRRKSASSTVCQTCVASSKKLSVLSTRSQVPCSSPSQPYQARGRGLRVVMAFAIVVMTSFPLA